MRPPKAGWVSAFVCDDVRLELDNRMSVMGLHGRHVEVEALPAQAVQICAVVFVRDPQEHLETVTISLVGPAGEILIPPASQKVQHLSGPDGTGAHQFQAKIAPYFFTAEGTIAFRFMFNDPKDEIGVEVPISVKVKNRQTSLPPFSF